MLRMWQWFQKRMDSDVCGWALGIVYIVAVATIWIAASYIVQSVVAAGVSPFLVTYICNSLFVVYIPIVEIIRYLEDSFGNSWFPHSISFDSSLQQPGDSETVNLLFLGDHTRDLDTLVSQDEKDEKDTVFRLDSSLHEMERTFPAEDSTSTKPEVIVASEDSSKQLDAKGRWKRTRVAKASLLVCPFWFFAQLTFNLSLKYTTVTSNTILSSASSLFTFLASLAFLDEKFTWVKFVSVLLCMGGTIIVSLGDSEKGTDTIATSPLLGDSLALVSSFLYAIYITLIRVKLPDERKGEGQASMAQFLGFLGLFNFFIFLPVALVLNFSKLEPFYKLRWKQFGVIVGKGLLDNVLSDYLWAKAILLTTTTVASAGLAIQVPLAAIVDSLTGHPPHLMDYLGAATVMVGFAGINIPSTTCCKSCGTRHEQEAEQGSAADDKLSSNNRDTTIFPLVPISDSA